MDDTPRCGVFSDIPGEFLGVGVARGKAPEDHFSLPEVGAASGGSCDGLCRICWLHFISIGLDKALVGDVVAGMGGGGVLHLGSCRGLFGGDVGFDVCVCAGGGGGGTQTDTHTCTNLR